MKDTICGVCQRRNWIINKEDFCYYGVIYFLIFVFVAGMIGITYIAREQYNVEKNCLNVNTTNIECWEKCHKDYDTSWCVELIDQKRIIKEVLENETRN